MINFFIQSLNNFYFLILFFLIIIIFFIYFFFFKKKNIKIKNYFYSYDYKVFLKNNVWILLYCFYYFTLYFFFLEIPYYPEPVVDVSLDVSPQVPGAYPLKGDQNPLTWYELKKYRINISTIPRQRPVPLPTPFEELIISDRLDICYYCGGSSKGCLSNYYIQNYPYNYLGLYEWCVYCALAADN